MVTQHEQRLIRMEKARELAIKGLTLQQIANKLQLSTYTTSEYLYGLTVKVEKNSFNALNILQKILKKNNYRLVIMKVK